MKQNINIVLHVSQVKQTFQFLNHLLNFFLELFKKIYFYYRGKIY